MTDVKVAATREGRNGIATQASAREWMLMGPEKKFAGNLSLTETTVEKSEVPGIPDLHKAELVVEGASAEVLRVPLATPLPERLPEVLELVALHWALGDFSPDDSTAEHLESAVLAQAAARSCVVIQK